PKCKKKKVSNLSVFGIEEHPKGEASGWHKSQGAIARRTTERPPSGQCPRVQT
ncbi:unnamed protein product, partial [Ilex paraguariensis]